MARLLLLLLLVPSCAIATQSITFSSDFQPSATYSVEYKSTNSATSVISMDEAPTDADAQQNVRIKNISNQIMQQTINTGASQRDGSYSFTSTIDDHDNERFMQISINDREPVTSKQSDKSPLTGLIVNGLVNTDGDVEFKSFSGTKIKPELEVLMKTLIEQAFNNDEMNGKTISVNDTLSFDVPMSIPLPKGGHLNGTANMLYTLDRLVDNIAYFNIHQSIDMTVEIDGVPLTTKGAGTGQMTYDALNKFSPSVSMNIKMHMDMPLPDSDQPIKVMSTTQSLTTVTFKKNTPASQPATPSSTHATSPTKQTSQPKDSDAQDIPAIPLNDMIEKLSK